MRSQTGLSDYATRLDTNFSLPHLVQQLHTNMAEKRTHTFHVSINLQINFKRSFIISVIKHFCKMFFKDFGNWKKSPNLHACFFMYIHCAYWLEHEQNFSKLFISSFILIKFDMASVIEESCNYMIFSRVFMKRIW